MSNQTEDQMLNIPELQHGEGSWVYTQPKGVGPGVRVIELYERSNVMRLAELGWSIESIGAYLHRLNERIKQSAA